MNVGIWTEAMQFLFWEYINWIFCTVYYRWSRRFYKQEEERKIFFEEYTKRVKAHAQEVISILSHAQTMKKRSALFISVYSCLWSRHEIIEELLHNGVKVLNLFCDAAVAKFTVM